MKTVKKSNDILVDFDSYDTRGQHDFTWSERTRREDKAHRSFDRHFYPTVVGGGGLFLACEDLGRMFDTFVPRLRKKKKLMKISRIH